MYGQSAEIYDLLYTDKDYATEAEQIRRAIHDRNPGARSLLDVACGTGRHLAQLRQWFTVEGVDIDPGLLAVAARHLPDVALHEGDMRDFDLGRTFDAVTCLFSSIAYVVTVAQMGRAVANMARHLAPAGVLIVEPWMTPQTFTPRFPGRLLTYEDDTLQAVRVSVGRVESATSVIDFHYLVARPGEIEHMTESHTMGLFTLDEYRAAFEGAGLATDYDAHGLIGRGLWIGQKTGPA